ncbi:hypothetical protein EGW08_019515 [Elysia chlorotica]|uniref:C-type lectin domain-containing protein n=1 Tax=Elysia chlorotica TaxID=188477 RepID=A0A3S0Z7V6_ELYCH|nr:hypothetical protein EGW08_019515 [Elysia chlorotica]
MKMQRVRSQAKGRFGCLCVLFLALASLSLPSPSLGADLMCSQPGPAPDGKPVGDVIKDSYAIGEEVTYKCDYSEATRIRSCETTGKWSPMGQVCSECPENFELNPEFGKCYYFPNILKSWVQGEAFCEQYGALMAFPENEAENLFLASFINYPTFIGITDRVQEGMFMTVTGIVPPYVNWNRGEPNNSGGGGEDCAENGGIGVWNDRNCENGELYFICQKDKLALHHCLDFLDNCAELFHANPNVCKTDPAFANSKCRFTCGVCGATSTPACRVDTPGAEAGDRQVLRRGQSLTLPCPEGMIPVSGSELRGCTATGYLSGHHLECAKSCPGEWTKNPANNFCYKLFPEKSEFVEAEAACAKIPGGLLTTAADEEELAFVSALRGSAGHIWIGLTDILVQGTYRWVDGTELTYKNWQRGEPNNRHERCVMMYTNTRWNDARCETKLPFVCKVGLEQFEEYAWFWSALRSGVSTLRSVFG